MKYVCFHLVLLQRLKPFIMSHCGLLAQDLSRRHSLGSFLLTYNMLLTHVSQYKLGDLKLRFLFFCVFLLCPLVLLSDVFGRERRYGLRFMGTPRRSQKSNKGDIGQR